MAHGLLSTYELLLAHFGPRHWWPSDSPLETAVGAILTQNTAWRNVEQAIARLKHAGLLDTRSLGEASVARVSELIRPAGYYRQKTRYVKAFAAFLLEAYDGDLANMGRAGTEELRAQLSANARAARKRYCWEIEEHILVELYAGLLAEGLRGEATG